MNLPTPVVTTTLPALVDDSYRARGMRWRHWSLALCASAAAASVQAGVIYGTSAEAQAWAYGVTTVSIHNLDPGNGTVRWMEAESRAGTTASATTTRANGNAFNAQGTATARGLLGQGSVSLSTDQQTFADNPHEYGASFAVAGALMELRSLISGTPGAQGKVVLTGSFFGSAGGFSTGPNARNSGADLSARAFMQSYAPADGYCLTAACKASDAARITLSNGEFIISGFDRNWRLEIDVRAGERLEVYLGAAASAGGGYSVGVGFGAPLPAGGLALGAASLSVLGDMGEDELAADFSTLSDFSAASDFSGMTRLWLSAGLSLADESGLYRQADGSYSFAPTATVPPPGAVPEPTSALLALAGLALLWRTRHKARA